MSEWQDPQPWRDVYGERWDTEGNDLRFYRPRARCMAVCPGEGRDLCYGQHQCALPAKHDAEHRWEG